MIKIATVCLLIFCGGVANGQGVQIRTKFSEPFAVFQFLNSISSRSSDNVYKRLFVQSTFHTKSYLALIAQFDSLNINYSYDFTDYPADQKIGLNVPNLLRRNLILCDSIQDFKIRSMGLVPNDALIRLTALLRAFTPVYDFVVYEPSKVRFRQQLQGVSELIKATNINFYFSEALQFYHSSWDTSVPFVFCFYPLPGSRGFTATAISDVAISAVADSLDNYKLLLSVMLHELSHILYDERPRQAWDRQEEWFDANPSKGTRYSRSLFNEAMATAVGNGYMAAQLNGKLDSSHRWYGDKYINGMAQAAYPLVKEYIEGQKPIDKHFIDGYVRTFDRHFSAWLSDPAFVMRGRFLLADDSRDVETVNRLFEPAQGDEDAKGFSGKQLEKIKASQGTKLIIVNRNNAAQLELVKRTFGELQEWQPKAGEDFTRCFFLTDKTWLLVLNNVRGSTADKLATLQIPAPG